MSSDMERVAGAPVPGRLGQATAVEQSRAVAEVQAAIVVAQQCPRDMQSAIRQMTASCGMKSLAERAFYRFPRGGSTVSGASVHLARELARCWGNVQYGIAEMRRDDEHGQSEMMAFAWDVETNTRSSQTFIVPHLRDKRGAPERLTDMRDIYENNANNGARRVREAIFAILPPWFTEEAKTLCNNTLIDGGGVPLPQRIAKAVEAFATLGVRADQLVQRIGHPSADWTAQDVAQLLVIFTSIQRGEIRIEDEFAPERVTAGEIAASKPAPKKAAPAAPKPAEPDFDETPAGDVNAADFAAMDDHDDPDFAADVQQPPGPVEPSVASGTITAAQSRMLFALLREHGITDRDLGLAFCADVIGREVDSTKSLSKPEAGLILDRLNAMSAENAAAVGEGEGE